MLTYMLVAVIIALLVLLTKMSQLLRAKIEPVGAIVVTIGENEEKEVISKVATLEFYDIDPYDVDRYKRVVLDVKAHDTRSG